MESRKSSKAYDQYKKFLDFCSKSLRGENPKFLDLIKTRYEGCDEQFCRSSKMVELLLETQKNMNNEESRKFVHLKDFLTELKAYSSHRKKKKVKRQRISSGSEDEMSPASKFPKLVECSVVLVKTEIPEYDSDNRSQMHQGKTKINKCSISDGNIDDALTIGAAKTDQRQVSKEQQGSSKHSYSFCPSPSTSSESQLATYSRNIHSPVPGCSRQSSSSPYSRDPTDDEDAEIQFSDKDLTMESTNLKRNAFRRKSVAIVDVDDGSEKHCIQAVVSKGKGIPTYSSNQCRDHKMTPLVKKVDSFSSDDDSCSSSNYSTHSNKAGKSMPPRKKSVSVIYIDESTSPDIMIIEPKKDDSSRHKKKSKLDVVFDNVTVKLEPCDALLVKENPVTYSSLSSENELLEGDELLGQNSRFVITSKTLSTAQTGNTSEQPLVKDGSEKGKKDEEDMGETVRAETCDTIGLIDTKAVSPKVKEPRRVPLVSCKRLSTEIESRGSSFFMSMSLKQEASKLTDTFDGRDTSVKTFESGQNRERIGTGKSEVKTASGTAPKGKSQDNERIEAERGSSGDGFETSKKAGNDYKENRKASDKHVRKLENLLESLRNEIEKCQKKELTLDDLEDETSAYVYESKLKNKFVAAWSKLCEITDRTVTTGRPTERRIRYNGTRYKEINRSLQKFLNKKNIFPDFHDVKSIVEVTNKKYKLGLRSSVVMDLSREAFVDIGEMLQTRRHQDFIATFGNRQTDSLRIGVDPYLTDPELRRKLDKNRSIARSNLEEVITKYTKLQYEKNDDDDEEEREEEDESEISKEKPTIKKKYERETSFSDDDTSCVSVEDVEVDLAGEKEGDDDDQNGIMEDCMQDKVRSSGSCPPARTNEYTGARLGLNPYLHPQDKDRGPHQQAKKKNLEEISSTSLRVETNPYLHCLSKKPGDSDSDENDDEDCETGSRNKINKLCPKISLHSGIKGSAYIKNKDGTREDEKEPTVSNSDKPRTNIRFTARKSLPPPPKTWMKKSESPGLSDSEDNSDIYQNAVSEDYTMEVPIENAEDTEDQSSDSDPENGDDNNDDEDEDLVMINDKDESESDATSDSSRGPSPVIISLSSSEDEDNGAVEDDDERHRKKALPSLMSSKFKKPLTKTTEKAKQLQACKTDEKTNVLNFLGLVEKTPECSGTEKVNKESLSQDTAKLKNADDSKNLKEKQTNNLSVKNDTDSEKRKGDKQKKCLNFAQIDSPSTSTKLSPTVAPDDCVIILDSPTKTPSKNKLIEHETGAGMSSQGGEPVCENKGPFEKKGDNKRESVFGSLLETSSSCKGISKETIIEEMSVTEGSNQGNREGAPPPTEDVSMESPVPEESKECSDSGKETTGNETKNQEVETESDSVDTNIGETDSFSPHTSDIENDKTKETSSKETENIGSIVTTTKTATLLSPDRISTTSVEVEKASLTVQANTKSEPNTEIVRKTEEDAVIIIDENSTDTVTTKSSFQHNKSTISQLYYKDTGKGNRQKEKNVPQCSSSSTSGSKVLSGSGFKTKWLEDAISKVKEEKRKGREKDMSDVILIDEKQGEDAVQDKEEGDSSKSKTESSETQKAPKEVLSVTTPETAKTNDKPQSDAEHSSSIPKMLPNPSFFSEFRQFISNNSRPKVEGVSGGFTPNKDNDVRCTTSSHALDETNAEKSQNISKKTKSIKIGQHINSEQGDIDACKSTVGKKQFSTDSKNAEETNRGICSSSNPVSVSTDDSDIAENDVSDSLIEQEICRDDSTCFERPDHQVDEPADVTFSELDIDMVIPESPIGSEDDHFKQQTSQNGPLSYPDGMHQKQGDGEQLIDELPTEQAVDEPTDTVARLDALPERRASGETDIEVLEELWGEENTNKKESEPEKLEDRENNASSADPKHNSSVHMEDEISQDSPMSDNILNESAEVLGSGDFMSLFTEEGPEEVQDLDMSLRAGEKNTIGQEGEVEQSNSNVSSQISSRLEKSTDFKNLPDKDTGYTKDKQSPEECFECEIFNDQSISNMEKADETKKVCPVSKDGSSSLIYNDSEPFNNESEERRPFQTEGTVGEPGSPLYKSAKKMESNSKGMRAESVICSHRNKRELLKDSDNVPMEGEKTGDESQEAIWKDGKTNCEETVGAKEQGEGSRDLIDCDAEGGHVNHNSLNSKGKAQSKTEGGNQGEDSSEVNNKEPDDIFRSISEICQVMLQNAAWSNDGGSRSDEEEQNKVQTTGRCDKDDRIASNKEKNKSEAELKTQKATESGDEKEKVAACGELGELNPKSNKVASKMDLPEKQHSVEEDSSMAGEPTEMKAVGSEHRSLNEKSDNEVDTIRQENLSSEEQGMDNVCQENNEGESVTVEMKKDSSFHEERKYNIDDNQSLKAGDNHWKTPNEAVEVVSSGESNTVKDNDEGLENTLTRCEDNEKNGSRLDRTQHEQRVVEDTTKSSSLGESSKDREEDGAAVADDINIIEELSYLKVMTSKGRSKEEDRKLVDQLIMDMSLKVPQENEKPLTKSAMNSNKSKVYLNEAEKSDAEKDEAVVVDSSEDSAIGSIKICEIWSQAEKCQEAAASDVTLLEKSPAQDSEESEVPVNSDNPIDLMFEDNDGNVSQEDTGASLASTTVDLEAEISDDGSSKKNNDCNDSVVEEDDKDDTNDIAVPSVEKTKTSIFQGSDIASEIISDVLRDMPPGKKTTMPLSTPPYPVYLHRNKHAKSLSSFRSRPYPSSNLNNDGKIQSSPTCPPGRQQPVSHSLSPHPTPYKQGMSDSFNKQAPNSKDHFGQASFLPKQSTAIINSTHSPRTGNKAVPQHLSHLPSLKPRVPIPKINPNGTSDIVRPLETQPVPKQMHLLSFRQLPRFPSARNRSLNSFATSVSPVNTSTDIPLGVLLSDSPRQLLNVTRPQGRHSPHPRFPSARNRSLNSFATSVSPVNTRTDIPLLSDSPRQLLNVTRPQGRHSPHPQNILGSKHSSTTQIIRRHKDLDGMEIVLDDSDNEDECPGPKPKSQKLSVPKIVSVTSLSSQGVPNVLKKQGRGLSLKSNPSFQSPTNGTTQSTNSSKQPSKKKGGDVIVLSDSE